jgi:hypothetical protein
MNTDLQDSICTDNKFKIGNENSKKTEKDTSTQDGSQTDELFYQFFPDFDGRKDSD